MKLNAVRSKRKSISFTARIVGSYDKVEMLRTRLLWFTTGFSVTGAAIAHYIWKDLWTDRIALSAENKQSFDTLEARVLDLERNLGRVEG